MIALAAALVLAPVARYTVTFDTKLETANVVAELPIQGGEVHTGQGAIDHVERGWAAFVKDLHASRNGAELTVTPGEKYRWKVDGGDGVATLRYKVDLSYARSKWPPGNEQAGVLIENALFTVTKPLFLSSADVPSEVRFEVPPTMQIAAPWTGQGGVFQVPGQQQLLDNSLVVGEFANHSFKRGLFDFQLVLLGDAEKDAGSLTPMLAKVADYYVGVFPKTPRATFLVTFFYADAEDGEAYSQSAAFTSANPIGKNNMIGWGNNLAHELFHFWNGHLISAANFADLQWLTEGFTEYYANLSLFKSRAISEDEYLRKVERHVSNYLYWRASAAFKNGSLKVAGTQKGVDRFAVYDGGWCMALWADLSLRQGSNGRIGLDDLMQSLYDQSLASGGKLTQNMFLDLIRRLGSDELSKAGESYIEGKATIPMETLLRRVGIHGIFQDYAGEIYLLRGFRDTAETRSLRKIWLSAG